MKIFFAAFLLAAVFLAPLFGTMQIVVEPEKESGLYDYSISGGEIGRFEKNNLACVLSAISEINMSTKGFLQLLNDISINGGSFEETAIIFDGIKMNNLQTGHFNMDIPVPLIGIGSVKIVKNAGSFAGAGAFAGAISIDPKKYEKDEYRFQSEYGTYNTQYFGLSCIRKVSDLVIDISAERASSDGYHYDTDFSKETMLLNLEYDKTYSLTLGYGEKAYGAFDFYTPAKNLASWEYLASKFAAVTLMKNNPLSITGFYSSHYDMFVLIRDNPSYYTNRHNSAFYGADINYEMSVSDRSSLKLKYEAQREEIQSKNLGNHYRVKNELIACGTLEAGQFVELNLNAALDKYDVYSSYDFMPSAAIVFKAAEQLKFNLGYAESVRYPDFTELFYNDPLNHGNAGLKAEKCAEYSGGAQFASFPYRSSVSVFYRASSGLIDWGKDNISDAFWKIENIGRVDTAGFTASAGASFEGLKTDVSYTFLDSHRDGNFISKYGLSYLRGKLCASTGFEIFTIVVKAEYTFENYINRTDVFNGLDLTLSREITGWLKLSLKSQNSLNWYFEETPGIPACGRIISAMAEMTF
jgi:vitamin B12 transporter